MGTTIAIVDDDDTILDAARLVLEPYRWNIRTYTTAESFLNDLVANGAPHCLVLDPHLPGMNGADIVRGLQNGYGDTPIIGLTARPDSELVAELLDAGVELVLTKPVAAEVLVQHIEAAIAGI